MLLKQPIINQRRSFISFANELQKYRIKKMIKVSPQVLFNVVSEVEHYHEFIPYCLESTITSRNPSTQLPERAELLVGWNSIKDRYESRLTIDSEQKLVVAESSDSTLFKELFTKWKIMDVGETKSMVDFELNFWFKSSMYNGVSKSFGPSIAEMMIKAFSERASAIENAKHKTA